ncbi:aKG-HExxH-type peptide beta-hydroxylase [Streptomyces sp. 8N706]|uniref:aKG-HExxH-type peptide beta-hydroxylase n=1 Tax=Streptomyces sp. 8N706 TaxID=3457416 RepID=UPI003FD63C9E
MTTTGRIRPAVLARLARTRSAPEDLSLLLGAQHSRRLVLLKSLLTTVERRAATLPPSVVEHFDRHWRLLEAAERHRPAAVREALGYPTVGGWLAQALSAGHGARSEREIGHFGAVAARAALGAGISFQATLSTYGGTLALPGLGVFRADEPWVRLDAGPRTVRITLPGGRPEPVLLRSGGRLHSHDPRWQTLRPLPGSTALLDDVDPHRGPRDGVGSAALRAAERAVVARDPWRSRWRTAMELVACADPPRAAELGSLLRSLVPLARGAVLSPDVRNVGATLRAAPGSVLSTLPATAEELAEVLVHEIQHSKLAVLADIAPLHHAGPEAVHRVAWRPDPRPFDGVLQGIYAHLALADFWWRAARRPEASASLREAALARHEVLRDQVGQALPILLASRELTCEGREFTLGMQVHLEELGRAARRPAEKINTASFVHDVR